MIFNLWACVPTVPSRSVPGCIKPLIFLQVAPAVSPVIYYVYRPRPVGRGRAKYNSARSPGTRRSKGVCAVVYDGEKRDCPPGWVKTHEAECRASGALPVRRARLRA